MLWQIFQDNKENSVLPMTHEDIWITEISLNLHREGWSNKIVSMSMDFMAYSLEKWPTEMCLFHHYCYSRKNIVTGHQNCPYHLWEDSEFFTHLVDKKLLFLIIIFSNTTLTWISLYRALILPRTNISNTSWIGTWVKHSLGNMVMKYVRSWTFKGNMRTH